MDANQGKIIAQKDANLEMNEVEVRCLSRKDEGLDEKDEDRPRDDRGLFRKDRAKSRRNEVCRGASGSS